MINDMHGLVRDIDIKEALQVGQSGSEKCKCQRFVKGYLQGRGVTGK